MSQDTNQDEGKTQLSLLKSKINQLSLILLTNRLFGKDSVGGLVPFLFNKTKDIKLRNFTDDDLHGTTLTIAELREFDGRTEDTPIYVALKGLVYDVSSNWEAYKPGSGYSCFVGKDATILYATSCCDNTSPDACPGTLETLLPEHLKELDTWVEFYHNHDKYKYVGRIIADPVESVLARELGYEYDEKMIEGSIDGIGGSSGNPMMQPAAIPTMVARPPEIPNYIARPPEDEDPEAVARNQVKVDEMRKQMEIDAAKSKTDL